MSQQPKLKSMEPARLRAVRDLLEKCATACLWTSAAVGAVAGYCVVVQPLGAQEVYETALQQKEVQALIVSRWYVLGTVLVVVLLGKISAHFTAREADRSNFVNIPQD